MVGEILAALMCYGLYSKTFRKSERRAYQGVRLDKPHKFPGNVGRMTSSSRCRETTGDLWKHSRRTNTNALSSMNYHPSLISLSAELPNSRQPRECRRTFLCMHGTPHPAPNFLQRDIDTVLSVLVTLGRRCWLSQREFFFTPKVSNPSRGNDKGDHTVAHHVSNSYDLTDPRSSSVLPCSDGAVTEEKAAWPLAPH